MDQKDNRTEQEIKEAEVKLEEKLTDEELTQVAGGYDGNSYCADGDMTPVIHGPIG